MSKCLWTTFLAEIIVVVIQKGFGLDLMRNLSGGDGDTTIAAMLMLMMMMTKNKMNRQRRRKKRRARERNETISRRNF